MRLRATVPLGCASLALILAFTAAPAAAQQAQKWVTTWAASSQGPYPAGYPSAGQPDLLLAFPSPELGASDQTFRLIVHPDIWGERARLRFSNAFGTKPVTFDHTYAGLQMSSASVVPGTNRAVTFGGRSSLILPPGAVAWSDPIALPFVHGSGADLAGRKLSVSFHIAGESGPMTWHAEALTTSYLAPPQSGARGQAEDEGAFTFSTTSWFFLDAVDVTAPADTRVIVAFGDSLTDGAGSTFNGDDRWSNDLARRLHAAYGSRVTVVNAGITGNEVAGPAEYSPQKPFPGGPSAAQRVERDVLSLSGVSTIIWLEGINDFRQNDGAVVDAVEASMKEVIARAHTRLPDAQVLGATLPSALSATPTAQESAADANRQALNDFVRNSRVFDGVVDFDKATLDPQTGSLMADLAADAASSGLGSYLHPNRAGHLAMANAVDLHRIAPTQSTGQVLGVQSPPIPPAPQPKPAMLEARPQPKPPAAHHVMTPIRPAPAPPAIVAAPAPPAPPPAAVVVNRPLYARPNECWSEDGYGRWSPCGSAGGGGD